MSVRVDMKEIQDACDWVSVGESAGVDAEAFVNRRDGRVVVMGAGIDEDVPHDLDDESIWIALPRRKELDLGRALVFRFVEEQMPQSIEQVERIFRKSGAYRRFKGLLDAADRLDQWHAYEQTATEQGLAQWCVENGFVPSPPAADRG
jgi:hypothetical protein